MHNVSYEVVGDKLVITVDVGNKALQSAPPSSSGKTRLLATTGGAISVPLPASKATNVSFALNVMVKP